MKLLVVSTLYPPVVRGGYEVECSAVVEHLRRCGHEVAVLTGTAERAETAPQRGVARVIPALPQDARGSLLAPPAALRAAEVGAARAGAETGPRLLVERRRRGSDDAARDRRRRRADRVARLRALVRRASSRTTSSCASCCPRGEVRRGASGRSACAASTACHRCALTHSRRSRRRSRGTPRRSSGWRTPPLVEPVLERIGHSVPRYGDRYAAVVRRPAPQPEIVYLGRRDAVQGHRDRRSRRSRCCTPSRDSGAARRRRPGRGRHTAPRCGGWRASRGVADAIDWAGPLDARRRRGAARSHPRADRSLRLGRAVSARDDRRRLRARSRSSPPTSAGSARECMTRSMRCCSAAATPTAPRRRSRARLSEQRETAARVERARERAERFRLEPYLEAQEQFVQDAVAALR